jgi:hypothetical protein
MPSMHLSAASHQWQRAALTCGGFAQLLTHPFAFPQTVTVLNEHFVVMLPARLTAVSGIKIPRPSRTN